MTDILIPIIIMATITYLIRVIPLVLINKEIKSKFLKDFLYYLPYNVLAVMTFPAIFYSTANLISGTIGSIVAIILAYCGRSLLQTSLITVAVVYIISLF